MDIQTNVGNVLQVFVQSFLHSIYQPGHSHQSLTETTLEIIWNHKHARFSLSEVLHDVKKFHQLALFPRGLHLPTLHITIPEKLLLLMLNIKTVFHFWCRKQTNKDENSNIYCERTKWYFERHCQFLFPFVIRCKESQNFD